MYSKNYAQYYEAARRSLTTFAILTILLIVITIVVACMCTHNFDKGLKPHIASRKLESDDEKDVHMADFSNRPPGSAPSRMTID